MIYNFFSDDESIDALVNSTKIDRYVPDTELEIRQIINGVVIPQVGVFEGRKFLPNSYWGGILTKVKLSCRSLTMTILKCTIWGLFIHVGGMK